MTSVDYFPLPPPWRRVPEGDSVYFINEMTQGRQTEHPLQGLQVLHFHPEESQLPGAADNEHALLGNSTRTDISPPTAEIIIADDVETLTETQHKHRYDNNSVFASSLSNFGNLQFRCEWKETGLFGDLQCFGLTIVYSVEHQKTLVKFDGIDNARWQYSLLEGFHGPVDRYDLFIGSRVKLLGRTLTISSAKNDAVEWIDREYKILLRKQEFLITKVESVGKKPVVRRQTTEGMNNIKRDFKGTGGRCDLRKILNGNKKLSDQLAGLGLAHFVTASKNLR